MTGDALQRFAAGDGLGTIRADTLNALVDSAKLVRQRLSKGNIGGRPISNRQGPGSLEVMVQNDTGSSLVERSIVELTTPLVDATVYTLDNQERPAFLAVAPTGATSSIAVLVDPLTDGAVGRAVLFGVAVVNLSVTNSGDGYCGPTASNTTRLTTAAAGPIRILWKESGTGDKLGIVLLQDSGGTLLTTANVDTTEESTTSRLEFDQDTGIRVDAGATDADPDVVSIDLVTLVEALPPELFDETIQVPTCLSIKLTKTYASTQLGGQDVLTDVTAALTWKTRTVAMLRGTDIGTAGYCVAPSDCCPDGEDPEVACCPDPVPFRLTLTISGGGGDFPLVWDAATSGWLTGDITVPGCGETRLRFACTAGVWGFSSPSGSSGYQCILTSSTPGTLTGCGTPAAFVSHTFTGTFTTGSGWGGAACGCGAKTFTITVPA